MNDASKNSRLMTTHCPPCRRPRMLAQPAIINGKRALAYMKGEELESYIPWDEAQEKMYQENLPRMTVNF